MIKVKMFVVAMHWAFLSCVMCGFITGCSKNATDDTAETPVTIYGESFGFRGTAPKQFLYNAEKILSVYSYDDMIYGKKVFYNESDWQFTEKDNTIARSANSCMPGLDSYAVNFNEDGTFTFQSEPRNPALIRQLQCFVDYETTAKHFYIEPEENSFFANKPNELPKVAVFGDSIANAAQTTAQYFKDTDADGFAGLLRSFLEKQYGKKNVCVDNFARTDSSIDLLMQNREKVIEGKYNAVIIEYGMNDHLSGVGGGYLFKHKLDEVCAYYKNAEIYLILVGFFQQNEKWDLEVRATVPATLEYNSVIKEIAEKYDAPFINIYAEFQNIASKKDIVEDLTVDWMHHPTDFGHKVYFSMLAPYFLKERIYSKCVDNWVLY